MKKPKDKNLNSPRIGKVRNFFVDFVLSRFILGLILFGALTLPVWAGVSKDISVEEVSKKVEDAQASVKDIQMDLSMEMKDSLSGAQQKVKGMIKIKSPDLVYVHYTQPIDQFLYAAGNLVQMYQPSQKMVYQQHNGEGKNSEPVYLGVGKELKKYIGISRVSIFKNTDSEIGLLFLPIGDDAGFDKMRVYIHKKDWWPYQMEVETPSTTTKAVFSNFSFNQGIPESLFQFTPPKSAQVVEGAVF